MERVRRRDARKCKYKGVRVLSVFFDIQRAQLRSAEAPMRVEIIDNTERKDQRGKEKQKEKSVRVYKFFRKL